MTQNPQTDDQKSADKPINLSSAAGRAYWVVSERTSEDGQKDIFFQVLAPGCPAEQQQLKDEIERTLSALRVVYIAEKAKFNEASQNCSRWPKWHCPAQARPHPSLNPRSTV